LENEITEKSDKTLPHESAELNFDEKFDKILNQITLDKKLRLLSGYRFFNTAPVKLLKLKPLRMTDGPFGVSMHSSGLRKNTRFPSTKALSSSWNRDLAYKFGIAIAEEVRSTGRHLLLAPGLNIDRTPLNGRTFEYFSEDPFLIKELAIPFIKAVQSQRIGACIKHYAVNNQETLRKIIDVQIDERTLHELYLRAFEDVVKVAKPWSLMTSYNKVNGSYVSEDPYLLRDILINKWGFNGFVVSDWGATFHKELSPKKCLESGLSLEMPYAYQYKPKKLKHLLEKGDITEENINDSIKKLFLVYRKVGLFENPKMFSMGIRNNPEHQELSRKIAEEGTVLLKNKGILPLQIDNIKSLAILGSNKNKKFGKLLYGGSSAVKPPYEITPEQGIINKCKGKIKFVKEPKSADIVILFLGLNHDKEGGRREFISGFFRKKKKARVTGNDSEEADRAQLDLPKEQVELINDTVRLNPNTVVVLINGSPLVMDDWIENVPAVVEAWYGGMEAGSAIANVLFGDVNPSGKLPISFPKSLKDSPAHKSENSFPGSLENLTVSYKEGIYIGYRHFDKFNINPLFPFGFGLSYTNFSYEDLKLNKSIMKGLNDSLEIQIGIKNTGERTGAEIIQVYASDLESKIDRPLKELVGFEKVELVPNEKKTIDITIYAKDLAYYDVISHDWKIDNGMFQIQIGSSSRDIYLKDEIDFTNIEL
jgi:beta-glucosidase